LIVTIQHSQYLPSLESLERMASADVVVLLDGAQFERGSEQNRTMVRVDAAAKWLTVPVARRSETERLLDKRIDWSEDFGKKHFLTLRHAYAESEYFRDYAGELRRIYETRWERLVGLNDALLSFLRTAYGIRTRIVRSSTLGGAPLGESARRSELALHICRAVGAEALLVGAGSARGELDEDAFEQAGIGIELQSFTHPQYMQCGRPPFTPGLSAVDMLFNCGLLARELLLEASGPIPLPGPAPEARAEARAALRVVP
jgi:hypothetical protein